MLMRLAQLALVLGAAQAGDVHVSAPGGFSIALPAAGWTFKEAESENGEQLVGGIELVTGGSSAGAPDPAAGAAPRHAQVRVAVTRNGTGASCAELRSGAQALLALDEASSDVRAVDRTLAGRAAPGLVLGYRIGDVDYTCELSFVDSGEPGAEGLCYQVRCLAPASVFAEHAAAFEGALASLVFLPPVAADETAALLERLTLRCGSEVEWADDWDAAARRAKREKKPVLVVIQSYPGFDIGDLPALGPFMDPDVIALANARTVPLRFRLGMQAPFVAPEVYGLSGTSFGVALLLIDEHGQVVRETFSLETPAVWRFIVQGLEQRAEWARVPKPPKGWTGLPGLAGGADPEGDVAEALLEAEWLARCGALDEARKLLERSPRLQPNWRVELARAEIARLALDSGEALACYARASGELGSPSGAVAGEIAERYALASLAQGDRAVALAALQHAAQATGESSPRARWLTGVLEFTAGDRELAVATWTALAEEAPDDRWSWWAAALASSEVLQASPEWNLANPTEELLALTEEAEPDPVSERDAPRAHAEALEWLLAHQRADGTWRQPAEIHAGVDSPTQVFTRANTAIAGMALLAEMELARAEGRAEQAERCREAAERVLAAMHTYALPGKAGADEPAVYMDYEVWAHAYALRFLCAAVAAEITALENQREALDALAASLVAKQKVGGGWSYYLSHSLAGSSRPSGASISFTTAAVVLALQEARALGAGVSGAVLESGLDCLEEMRGANGCFVYMLEHAGGANVADSTSPVEGAGRGPACSLPLVAAGRIELAGPNGLAEQVRTFAAHVGVLAREQGKCLMHAGPQAQGSHYLFFDYAMAAEAWSRLERRDQAKTREAILEPILAARCADGSFVDNPLLGRDLGTAMALMAFVDLAVPCGN